MHAVAAGKTRKRLRSWHLSRGVGSGRRRVAEDSDDHAATDGREEKEEMEEEEEKEGEAALADGAQDAVQRSPAGEDRREQARRGPAAMFGKEEEEDE